MKPLLFALLAAALAGPVLAADTPGGPPTFATKGPVAPTLTDNPVSGPLKLGRQAIVLEQTDLSKIAERAEARIGHRGRGGEEVDWVCLTDEATETRLWMTSSSVADGAVDGLTLVYLPKVQATEACPDVPDDWRKIILPGGLALKMSGEDLKAKVGKASYDRYGLVGFSYVTPRIGGGTRTAQVWAAVSHGKVGALRLAQFTSER
jgi:hypothetical protein